MKSIFLPVQRGAHGKFVPFKDVILRTPGEQTQDFASLKFVWKQAKVNIIKEEEYTTRNEQMKKDKKKI